MRIKNVNNTLDPILGKEPKVNEYIKAVLGHMANGQIISILQMGKEDFWDKVQILFGTVDKNEVWDIVLNEVQHRMHLYEIQIELTEAEKPDMSGHEVPDKLGNRTHLFPAGVLPTKANMPKKTGKTRGALKFSADGQLKPAKKKTKRVLTPEGRANIVKALKKRWAEYRRVERAGKKK